MSEQYKLTIEYDGSAFHGSQAQIAQHGRTVQGELEAALARLTGGPVRVALAGRTDAGVHALGQVASFGLMKVWTPERLQRALNGVLPADLAVSRAESAATDFHARFSAKGRAYRYLIRQAPAPAPLLRERAWHLRMALDVEAMQEAAKALLGEHDFAAFSGSGLGVPGQVPREGQRNTRREMYEAACYVWPAVNTYEMDAADASRGRLIAVDLAANAFLPQMVRTIVSTLVQVGNGKLGVADFAQILAGADRRLAAATAPPHGLCLLRVWY